MADSWYTRSVGIQIIDRQEWAFAEMERLLIAGVLEVTDLPEPRKKPDISTGASSVYIMRVGEVCKIGFAKDPEQRRADIQVGNHQPVEILYSIPSNDHRRLERRLHDKFSLQRLSGEWFRLSKADIETAIRIMEDANPVPSRRLSAAVALCEERKRLRESQYKHNS